MYTCCISKNSQFAITGGMDSVIYVFDLKKKETKYPTKELFVSGGGGGINCLQFLTDHQILSGSAIYLSLWDLESYECVRDLESSKYVNTFQEDFGICYIDCSPIDPNLIVYAGAYKAKLFDIRCKKPCKKIDHPMPDYVCLQFRPDGKIFALAGEYDSIQLYDIRSDKKFIEINLQKSVSSIQFSSLGTHLYVGVENGMELYNIGLQKCECMFPLEGEFKFIYANDKYVALADRNGSLLFFGDHY